MFVALWAHLSISIYRFTTERTNLFYIITITFRTIYLFVMSKIVIAVYAMILVH